MHRCFPLNYNSFTVVATELLALPDPFFIAYIICTFSITVEMLCIPDLILFACKNFFIPVILIK